MYVKEEKIMQQKEKKSFSQYMRSLHRDIGFLVMGLTIIYCVSGIMLIYRHTGLLKHETLIEKQISPDLEATELCGVLRLRNFKVLGEEDNVIYFNAGTYNKTTGLAVYSVKKLPPLLNKFTRLHKSSNKNSIHWFTTVFGILLLFMAISSLWMLKFKEKLYHKGIYIMGIGILAAIILLLL